MSEFNESKYKNDFAKEKYDRIIVTVPKGQKSTIETHRKNNGYTSLNAYICELIRKDMNENNKTVQTGDIKIEQSGNGKQNINIG